VQWILYGTLDIRQGCPQLRVLSADQRERHLDLSAGLSDLVACWEQNQATAQANAGELIVFIMLEAAEKCGLQWSASCTRPDINVDTSGADHYPCCWNSGTRNVKPGGWVLHGCDIFEMYRVKKTFLS
jgi:hypothetical protein